MEDFLTVIFVAIFFFGGFLLKLFKGYMEEAERERTHKNIHNRSENQYQRKRTERKIGGANVYERNTKKPSVQVAKKQAPVAPQTSTLDDAYENEFEDYEETLRELQAEIKTHTKKNNLSGEICGECYDYHATASKISEQLKDKSSLANAVIMSEILSKPLAMRSYEESAFFK